MKKSVELKKELETLRNEIKSLKDSGKIEEAHAKLNGLKELDPDHLGENFMEFWLRVEKGLLKVVNQHRDTNHNVLIVSHGMTIRNMLHELIPDFQLSELIGNASLNIVEYSEGKFNLKVLNQTNHFALRKEAKDDDFSFIPIKMRD